MLVGYMPLGKARVWTPAAVGAAVLLLGGCGSPKSPDQAVSAHPAADPPSRLCSIAGPPLMRQAVPKATGAAKSTTIDQRTDAFVNRTVAQCTLLGSGGSLRVTLTRYGMARDGSGTRHVRGGLERAKEFFTKSCGDAATDHPVRPDEPVGDQECLTNSRSEAGRHSEVFYRSRRGSDDVTVGYVIDRPHPAYPTTAQATELGRGIATNIWQAVK
jgi:hypothetical protein